jgi:biopolymer transport protein ExbD
MAHFQKKSAKTKQDREVELQVQVNYSEAENIEKIEQKRLVSYVYIGPERLGPGRVGETKVQIDDAIVDDIQAIRTIMYDKLLEQPRLIVSLRIDKDSDFGLITDVTQELRHAGTLRINYSTKREI